MPPLARRDVRNLVRKLGANARPSQQRQALDLIVGLSFDGDSDSLVAIAAAGAIPQLVQLLGPGSTHDLQQGAAAALTNLGYQNDVNKAAIASAGAIPPLVQLRSGSPADVQEAAVRALVSLSYHDDNAVTIAASGAIPSLVQLLTGSPAGVQEMAAGLLGELARNNAEKGVVIANAGAIPPLIQLNTGAWLSSGSAGVCGCGTGKYLLQKLREPGDHRKCWCDTSAHSATGF
jgi:hypothetical protein